MRVPKTLLLLAAAALTVALSSCTRLNSRPPASILSVSGFGKGKGTMAVTFVLGDASGAMTTADGTARVTVFELEKVWAPLAGVWTDRKVPVFTTVVEVHRRDFAEVRDPVDTGRPETILYSLGLLHYDQFDRRPTEPRGLVEVAFHTADGRILKGSDQFNF